MHKSLIMRNCVSGQQESILVNKKGLVTTITHHQQCMNMQRRKIMHRQMNDAKRAVLVLY